MNDQSDLRNDSRAVADYRALQREQAEAAGMPPPTAWELYRPVFFRLPGVEGSALFLRTTVFPGERRDVLAVDIGLLNVQQALWLLGREVPPGFTARLSQFFIAVASEDHPAGSTDIEGLSFDVVDSDGAYIGGVISPGVNTSLEALHMAAAALPHVDISRPERVIGTNTVACMQSGIYWGYVGLVEGIVRQVRLERMRPMKVIATGGLAPLFGQGTDIFDSVEDDLTMHGLVLIHRHNMELEDG